MTNLTTSQIGQLLTLQDQLTVMVEKLPKLDKPYNSYPINMQINDQYVWFENVARLNMYHMLYMNIALVVDNLGLEEEDADNIKSKMSINVFKDTLAASVVEFYSSGDYDNDMGKAVAAVIQYTLNMYDTVLTNKAVMPNELLTSLSTLVDDITRIRIPLEYLEGIFNEECIALLQKIREDQFREKEGYLDWNHTAKKIYKIIFGEIEGDDEELDEDEVYKDFFAGFGTLNSMMEANNEE